MVEVRLLIHWVLNLRFLLMRVLSEGRKRKSSMIIFNVLLEGWFILTNLTTLITFIICNFMHVSHVIP